MKLVPAHGKKIIFYLAVCAYVSTAIHAQQIASTTPQIFSEGIVISRTTFPGHPLNDSLKKLDFETCDFLAQYHVIQALKKHQQLIKGENEQEIKDAFLVSGMMVLPAYSKMYFT